jgi:hypothetical protein
MGNISYNRIDTVISEASITSIKTNLQHILTLLPDCSLTANEKKSFRGMDADNKVFTEDCINLLRSNGAETMPSYIKVDNLIADLQLFEQLDILKLMLNQIMSQVNDAQRLAGKEAYDIALKVYELYETAAKSGVPGSQTSFDKLNQRFKTNSGRKSDRQLKRKAD